MNYLAHIQLAAHSDVAMLGAFLGDFLRPQEAVHLGPEVVREILVHRAVDRFTDAHAEVRAARRLCAPTNRLFARISLDVYFDHLLARSWDDLIASDSGEPLPRLAARFYAALADVRPRLPSSMHGLVGRMIGQDWLGSYADPPAVDAAIARLAQRLSCKGDHLIASLAELRVHEDAIDAGFRRFYPELQRIAADQRRSLADAEAADV